MVRPVAFSWLREKEALSRTTDHLPTEGAALGEPFRVTISAQHMATSEICRQPKPGSGDLFMEGLIKDKSFKGVCDHETAST